MQKRTYEPRETVFCPVKLPTEFPIVCMHIDHWYTENRAVNMLHFHNCLQIGYCYEGSGYSLVEGKLTEFESGNVTVIPANTQHHIVSHPNTVSRWIWLYLDPFTFVPDLHPTYAKGLMRIFFGDEAMPFILCKDDQNEMINITHAIINEMENRDKGYQDIVRLQTHAFLILLLRAASGIDASSFAVAQTTMQIIAPAVQYIALHYMENISIQELGRLCHVSTTHLRRVFRHVMKCSPLEYLQMVRLEAACILLFRSDLSVLEVGNQVGFPTVTSFTRQFKKLMQTTPGQWRKQSRNAKK